MNLSRTATTMGLLLSVALLAGGVAWAADMPAVGSAAPDFTLSSQEGKQVSCVQNVLRGHGSHF
jgi:hypothetical protein